MCFAPQRRALFRHLNFQKCPEPVSFLHFWLRNVLRATTACTFSTSQLPKVLRQFLHFWLRNVLRATTACTFSSLIWLDGSAPAASASPLFDPPEPQIIGKTQCFATFLPFRAPGSSFFGDFLFFDLLSSFFFLLSSFFFLLSSLLFSSLLFFSLLFSSLPLLFSSLLFSCLVFSSLLLSCLLFSSLVWLSPISAFHLSILSEVWRLNFLR